MKARALLVAAAGVLVIAARAPYALPPEPQADLPQGPGADLAAAHCAACHSLDYVETQPRGKGAKFWSDAVTKMINVYGAPIDPDQARAISDYLARTYG